MRPAPDLATITGTTVPTAGVSDICTDDGLVMKDVAITSGMGVPLLIGTDVLEMNKGVLDYSKDTLVLGSKSHKFVQRLTKSSGVAEVLLESDLDGLTRQFEDVFYSKKRGLQEAFSP